MATDLTDRAFQGFMALPDAKRPYYATSDAGAAWEIGRDCLKRNLGSPKEVLSSRGYNYNVIFTNGSKMVARVDWKDGAAIIHWTARNRA
jgi:hypothetical protein